MAPEQFRAERADARTDQFSFCVSLYEALYGERPFAGDSLAALIEAVGRRAACASRRHGCRVPAWLRKVRAARPLGQTPRIASPSMDGPARRARPRSGAAAPARAARRRPGGVLLAGAPSASARCRHRARRCAADAGAEARRRSGSAPESDANAPHPRRDAFAPRSSRPEPGSRATSGSARPRSSTATPSAGPRCTRTRARRRTCAASNPRRCWICAWTASTAIATSLRALTDVFATADADSGRQRDGRARMRCPTSSRCADVAVLRAVLPPPRDSAVRRQVARLRQRAAEARALGDAGRWKDGLAKARPLLAEAERLGYEPVVAEVLALLGLLTPCWARGGVRPKRTSAPLWAAEATRHDEAAAEAAVMLAGTTGLCSGDSTRPSAGAVSPRRSSSAWVRGTNG